jgi:hypothetical protein
MLRDNIARPKSRCKPRCPVHMSLSIASLSGCNLLSNARLQVENLLSNPPRVARPPGVVETNDRCIIIIFTGFCGKVVSTPAFHL